MVVSICAPCPVSTRRPTPRADRVLHGVDQVGEGAAEAVELPDDEHVARPERAHAAVESRAVIAEAGREVVVDVAGVDALGLQRVATRASRSARAATIFVNLRRFPKTVEAVQDVVAAIRSRRIDEVGSVCEWPEDLVRAGDWSPVQWFDPELAQAARTVRELPGMSPLSAVFEIGPPGQSVRDEFERVAGGSTGSEGIPVFDSVSGPLRTCLEGEPDAFWRVRPDSRRRRRAKSGLVESHLRRAGWVLLALRAYTHNASVVALCYREKSLGNGFIPIVTPTELSAKALCVLWNSTPTLLQLLNARSRKLTYPMWSVKHLASVQVPRSLTVGQVTARLAGVYERVSHVALQPWAQADTSRPARDR